LLDSVWLLFSANRWGKVLLNLGKVPKRLGKLNAAKQKMQPSNFQATNCRWKVKEIFGGGMVKWCVPFFLLFRNQRTHFWQPKRGVNESVFVQG